MMVPRFPLSRTTLLATLTACGVSALILIKLRSDSLRSSVAARRAHDKLATKDVGQKEREGAEQSDLNVDVEDPHGVSTSKACQELAAVYQRVRDQFESGGLDLATIKAIQPWFHGMNEDSETPWPKRYEEFPGGALPVSSVRLLVVPLDDAPSVAAAASAVTRDVLAVLPKSTKVFCNARSNYHCTVFHTSHPSDLRPDPFTPGGGLGSDPTATAAAGPRQETLDAEAKAVAEVVSSVSAPCLILDSVVMANSGTLLLTWVDPSGHMAELRAKLRETFPGACTKQASIIHSSLLRVLSAEQLSKETINSIGKVCTAWTKKLKGKVVVPSAAWWAHEHEFSTIVGDRTLLQFQRR